jgi:hypothetical protein
MKVASGEPTIAMVLQLTVARSPSSERKLWTRSPSSVHLVRGEHA